MNDTGTRVRFAEDTAFFSSDGREAIGMLRRGVLEVVFLESASDLRRVLDRTGDDGTLALDELETEGERLLASTLRDADLLVPDSQDVPTAAGDAPPEWRLSLHVDRCPSLKQLDVVRSVFERVRVEGARDFRLQLLCRGEPLAWGRMHEALKEILPSSTTSHGGLPWTLDVLGMAPDSLEQASEFLDTWCSGRVIIDELSEYHGRAAFDRTVETVERLEQRGFTPWVRVRTRFPDSLGDRLAIVMASGAKGFFLEVSAFSDQVSQREPWTTEDWDRAVETMTALTAAHLGELHECEPWREIWLDALGAWAPRRGGLVTPDGRLWQSEEAWALGLEGAPNWSADHDSGLEQAESGPGFPSCSRCGFVTTCRRFETPAVRALRSTGAEQLAGQLARYECRVRMMALDTLLRSVQDWARENTLLEGLGASKLELVSLAGSGGKCLSIHSSGGKR